MTLDHYACAAARWASGATLVYGPIARMLVASSPRPLAGRWVLDAGAGTGAVSWALLAQGARVVACDLSVPMLAAGARARPPAVAADVRALPFAPASVDGCVAAFLLNHLVNPGAAFRELMRVTRPGGAVLATVFATVSRSPLRDRVDELARAAGFAAPEWYVRTKAEAVPLLGDAASMERAARACGLERVEVEETAVDVGVTRPEELVDYRLGQAQYSGWLDAIGEAEAAELRDRVVEDIRPVMEPYRPSVVFLRAVR